ncbi:MAG: hypothetical protein HY816_21965 [Candidatus Wallbacteria bacterium]|nr:hypothetical protein [Candidatus Wallbacteria bacterium]
MTTMLKLVVGLFLALIAFSVFKKLIGLAITLAVVLVALSFVFPEKKKA